MTAIALYGNPNGAGAFTVAAPSSANTQTLTLPDATTTLVGTDTTQSLTNKSFDSAPFATVAGTAPLYGCRAWVVFNGTRNVTNTGASTNGQPVYIRSSGNVTSVTKNATGDYTINFTTAMPDENYVLTGINCGLGTSSNTVLLKAATVTSAPTNQTASGVTIISISGATQAVVDSANLYVSIFR